MNEREPAPVTSRDYWAVLLVALFWILLLLVLTQVYNLPPAAKTQAEGNVSGVFLSQGSQFSGPATA